MEITAKSIADRKDQLIAELNTLTAQEWMIRGKLEELTALESYLSMGIVEQAEMDKVRDFPTSESR